jgi:hypothetical protein
MSKAETKKATSLDVTREIARKARHRREEHMSEDLNVVPMMDMMVIILVFLLKLAVVVVREHPAGRRPPPAAVHVATNALERAAGDRLARLHLGERALHHRAAQRHRRPVAEARRQQRPTHHPARRRDARPAQAAQSVAPSARGGPSTARSPSSPTAASPAPSSRCSTPAVSTGSATSSSSCSRAASPEPFAGPRLAHRRPLPTGCAARARVRDRRHALDQDHRHHPGARPRRRAPAPREQDPAERPRRRRLGRYRRRVRTLTAGLRRSAFRSPRAWLACCAASVSVGRLAH